jgi:hypothetical protein
MNAVHGLPKKKNDKKIMHKKKYPQKITPQKRRKKKNKASMCA